VEYKTLSLSLSDINRQFVFENCTALTLLRVWFDVIVRAMCRSTSRFGLVNSTMSTGSSCLRVDLASHCTSTI